MGNKPLLQGQNAPPGPKLGPAVTAPRTLSNGSSTMVAAATATVPSLFSIGSCIMTTRSLRNGRDGGVGSGNGNVVSNVEDTKEVWLKHSVQLGTQLVGGRKEGVRHA